MIDMPIPEIRVIKNTLPSIYLDTNVLIELSRYEKGCCKNEHIEKIEALYRSLLKCMQEKRILCVLGHQLEEMGTSQRREAERDFLFRFTNVEFKSPHQVEKMQKKKGYQAFEKKKLIEIFNVFDIIESPVCVSNSSIEIHAVPMYTPEKAKELKQEKQNLAKILNDVKKQGRIAKNFEDQLALELKAEIQVFQYNLEHYNDSWQGYMHMNDALIDVYRRVGIDPINASDDERINAVSKHNSFLVSPYHHKLPCVWIRSVLFAHIMQRQNKIIHSDNLDITWASAYLPFIDYAITDTSFCNLLNQSGLAESYGTKVYCFKTLGKLLEEL